MYNRSLISCLVFAQIFLTAAVFAQNTPHVNHVSVRQDGSAFAVEIHTTGAVASPNTQAVTGPDRIVVDFPGALPAAELRALMVNRGPLKGVRSGLFFNNPPITRIVLDLTAPQNYQIVQTADGYVVRLGAAGPGLIAASLTSTAPEPRIGSAHLTSVAKVSETPGYRAPAPTVTPASPLQGTPARPTPMQATAVQATPAAAEPQQPVAVNYQNGLLKIHADRATLAQVLYEVQRQTQAEIAIPAGAEQEQVVTDLGPAPPRDVLA